MAATTGSSSSSSGRSASTNAPFGSWEMMPVSTPCVSIAASRRCSPKQIRRVTQKAITGPMKIAYRAISVVVYSGICRCTAIRSFAPSSQRTP